MILVKNLNFHASLFLFKKHLAILFNNVLKRKPAFLNYKKVVLKKAKKFLFLQRVLLVSQPGVFGQKFELSSISVFLEKTPWNNCK